ncbi:MAG TPA: hypothetical protein VLH86_03000 [Patescibacteria group bacterium]|nr:hypothetical protein [Patescibacteria group bacterium]
MREVRRRQTIQPRGILARSADGRLKPASEELEVADIWAEQKRIRLAEAIAADKRKAEKKLRRQQRKLFRRSPAATPSHASGAAKEIEIKISLPKIDVARALRQARARIPKATPKQRLWLVAGLVVIVFVTSTQGLYNKGSGNKGKSPTQGNTAVSGAATQVGGTPDYPTVLPAGKTIDKLGGWGRVSPADKNPVFAYSDSLNGMHIIVSEQPLPSGFNGDLQNRLAQVAKQFNTTEKVTLDDGSTMYLGVATNGAQSVVFSKHDLLILVRSVSKVDNQSWASYANSLQ